MCATPVLGQKVKGQSHMGPSKFFRVHSMVPCLFHGFTSYLAQIQPMRRLCVMRHFQTKNSKVKVTRVVHR